MNGLINRSVLQTQLGQYDNFNDKVHRMIQSGELIQLVRGKYIYRSNLDAQNLSKYQVANGLYGPSYVSFYSALEYFGSIPERVETIESATIRRSRAFDTSIGRFDYQKVQDKTFAIGISYIKTERQSFLMANPTKALIDILWRTDLSGIYGKNALYHYLMDDLRLEASFLADLHSETLKKCISLGKKKRLLQLLLNLHKGVTL